MDSGWSPAQIDRWKQTVAEFAGLMTLGGVKTDVDLYHLHDVGIDWTRYGPDAIDNADYVLVAISQAWTRRFDGSEHSTVGAGAAREADALMSLYQKDRKKFLDSVLLVYLPEGDTTDIPATLHGVQRFTIRELTASGLEDLLRTIHGQPRYVPPPLGAAPTFRSIVSPSSPDGSSPSTPRDDLEALRSRLASDFGSSSEATVRGIDAALGDQPQDATDQQELKTSLHESLAAGLSPEVRESGPSRTRFQSQFLMPPQGRALSWHTEPLLRLRVAALVTPTTVDTVDALTPRTRAALCNKLDGTQLTSSLRSLSTELVPTSAMVDDQPVAEPRKVVDWSVATEGHLTSNHATFQLGGDATSGIAALMTVSLPMSAYGGDVNLVIDIGISVIERISILTIGRLSSDALVGLHDASLALTSIMPVDSALSLAGITLTAPTMIDSMYRPNSIAMRADFSAMGQQTRKIGGDLGVSFELLPGFMPSDAAGLAVGAIERIMIDAGFVDPTQGVNELAEGLGVDGVF
jgi:hypothetical protein